MRGDDIEVRIIQAVLNKVVMRFSQVASRVVCRATAGHRQERLLLGHLSVHVDVIEEAADAIIRQHATVENLDRGLHRGFASESFVNTAHRKSLHRENDRDIGAFVRVSCVKVHRRYIYYIGIQVVF